MFKMFKKIICLSLIALMLFSFVAGVSAQNNLISIYSKTQDNDGDGVIEVYNKNEQLLGAVQIKKGERKTWSLENFDKVVLHSKDRSSFYNARIEDLTNYWNDRNMDGININVDVNFYSKRTYFLEFDINHDVYTENCNTLKSYIYYINHPNPQWARIYYGNIKISNRDYGENRFYY